MASPQDLAARFGEELMQLRTSEKIVINFLTSLARDYLPAAPLIAKEIEAKLLVRETKRKGGRGREKKKRKVC